jgi:hypothetical protein
VVTDAGKFADFDVIEPADKPAPGSTPQFDAGEAGSGYFFELARDFLPADDVFEPEPVNPRPGFWRRIEKTLAQRSEIGCAVLVDVRQASSFRRFLSCLNQHRRRKYQHNDRQLLRSE